MSISYIITCDACGHQLLYRFTSDKEDEGWLEVYVGESGDSLDFCTRECNVAYFNSQQEEE